ncbi:MAG TPA: 3-deoxy-D-manno-octulosonic acid transferase [Pirellulales bacterium]|nr:3-deoxy-D-manno-octulosonic acid transferase [Pirellulales bacterium]
MRYLLNFIYGLLIVAASPLLVYRAIAQKKYRQGWGQKLLGLAPRQTGEDPCVWFHAVSVGEVNLLAPLLNEIARRRPNWRCVVSTTTATGFALAKKKYPSLTVFYCPLDFSWAVQAAMLRICPTCLVLTELELWPNLIAAARRHGARVAVINGRLSEQSYRGYRRVRQLVKSALGQLDLIAAQNQEYADRFLALGAPASRVYVTGSLKFDGAQTDRANAATLRMRQLAGIADDDLVFLAGSTQSGEETAALAAYRALAEKHPRLRLILVPRHPERFDAVADELDRTGLPWQRRSRLGAEDADRGARVLLVDTIGELGAWWGASDVAFVGGSLSSRGGQNMIEPAAYGAAVCFGPNTRNFRDVVTMLLDHQAAVVVHDADELTAFVGRCLADHEFAELLGRHARLLVASQLGATRRTFELLDPLIAPMPVAPARAA